MPQPLPRLTAAQAAARLGVKPATLYAYVSRGLLSRERTAAGSTFDPLEIEGFARRARRGEPGQLRRSSSAGGAPLLVLDTDIALIEDDELYFRGVPAAQLAAEQGLEAVAAWLWGEQLLTGRRFRLSEAESTTAGSLLASLPPSASMLDRIQLAVAGLAADDPLRYDATADSLRRVGRRLLLGVPAALARQRPAEGVSVAEALWAALGQGPPSAAQLRALDAALVLVVDHDLAVSTLAARVAACARGSGYAVVTAALGAFDSPLHGNASRGAVQLLGSVMAGEEPELSIALALRDGGRGVPGFGHAVYRGPDARVRALRPVIDRLPAGPRALAALDAVAEVVRRRAGAHPNLDLALAALVLAAGLRQDAGSAIFAIGRMGGWIAHALNEYEQRPLRLRPSGRYIGP